MLALLFTGSYAIVFAASTVVEGCDDFQPGSIVYVDQSAAGAGTGANWADAFTSLQDALTFSCSCPNVSQIWVAAGTYYPDEGSGLTDNDRNATFQLCNAVAIYGAFNGTESFLSQRDFAVNITTLSGDINQTLDGYENAYTVVTGSGTDATAILDGFVITLGNADDFFEDPSSAARSGGGMYNVNGNPVVANCTFYSNFADHYGGGMYNSSSNPVLTNCTFDSNSSNLGGGGMYNTASSPSLTSCLFVANMSQNAGGMNNENVANPVLTDCTFDQNFGMIGGAMNNYLSEPLLDGCSFTFNYGMFAGGGMYNSNGHPTILNCGFMSNTADFFGGGGVYNEAASPVMTNCVFSANSGGFAGGAIYNNFGSAPRVINCTVTENISFSGGGMYSASMGDDPVIVNSIFWDNGDEIYLDGGSVATIEKSIIAGGCPFGAFCSDVMDTDPMFADMPAGDLSLSLCSPALNIGDNDANASDEDMEGNDRIFNTTIDLGAYELQQMPPEAPAADAQTFCTDDDPVVADLTATGENLTWYDAAVEGNVYGPGEPLSTGTYYVSQTIDGCESDRTAVEVMVFQNPSCSIAGSMVLCPGALAEYSAPVDMASYTWSISGDGTAVSQSSGQTFTVMASDACDGSFTLTLTVISEDNCATQCEIEVIVINDDAPVFTSCPTSVFDLGCNPVLPGEADAIAAAGDVTDACGSVTISANAPEATADNCFYTQTWTVTATDDCGNASECEVTYTWTVDTTPPVFTNCPGGVIDLGCNPSLPTSGDAIADAGVITDGCGELSIDALPQAPVQNNCDFTQTWAVIAEDLCGNQSVCVVTYAWRVDDSAPVFTSCPQESFDLGYNPVLPVEADAIAAAGSVVDACGAVTVEASAPAPTQDDCDYTQTWTVTATDECGNASACEVTYTWRIDTEDPDFDCGSLQTLHFNTEAPSCTNDTDVEIPVAVDNCAGNISAVGTRSDALPLDDPWPVGTTTIEWMFTDEAFNTTTCYQDVMVTDDDIPSVACPEDITAAADAGVCTAAIAFEAPSADNCGVATTVYQVAGEDVSSPHDFPVGTTTVDVTVTDVHGNSNTCSFTVTVEDHQAPAVSCPSPSNPYTADEGACTATLSFEAGSSDNCAVATTVYSVDGEAIAFPYDFPVGTTTVDVLVTDIHANTNDCSFDVTVEDNEIPAVTCPTPANPYHTDADECLAALSFAATSSDNCGVLSTVYSVDGQEISYPYDFVVGTTTVDVLVTDIHGNTNGCAFDVVVEDHESPVALCQDVTLTLSGGVASTTPESVNNGSEDACGIADLSLDVSAFDCGDIGANIVTLTVTDIHGNMSACAATVHVVGVIPTCSITAIPSNTTYTGGVPTTIYLGYGPQSVTLSASGSGGGPFTYSWEGEDVLSCYDCAAPVYSPTVQGNYLFYVTVTNSYGCTVTCEITICVIDVRVPGNNQNNPKIYVCHGGNNPKTTEAPLNTVANHINNHAGDYLGQCGQNCDNIGNPAFAGHDPHPGLIYADDEFAWSVSPSLFRDHFDVTIHSLVEEVITLQLYDMVGKLVYHQSVDLVKGYNHMEVSTSDRMAAGMYILSAEINGSLRSLRLLKE